MLPVLAALIAFSGAAAQRDSTALPLLFVNDEMERYARVLQVAGVVPAYPWSVRPFDLHDIHRLNATSDDHPWQEQYDATVHTVFGSGLVRAVVLPSSVQVIENSTFPFGYNDGAVWAGRGITTVVNSGAAAFAGPVTLVLAPVFFDARNVAYSFSDSLRRGFSRYRNEFDPSRIDAPQRFGITPYARLDPGNSGVYVTGMGVTAAFTNENEYWGPARDNPALLGNNAPGFPHVAVGSSRPWNVGLGHVYGRMIWGRLWQSDYAYQRSLKYRYATGAVAAFTPRGVPGLEIGAARFFQLVWTPGVLNATNLARVFEGFLKVSRIAASGNPHGEETDDQLASLFARWVFPDSHVELYGEFGREDSALDTQDLLSEPDHASSYLIGLQRVWPAPGNRLRVFRGELLNSRANGLQVNRVEAPFYEHYYVRQGFTNGGQVLGSVGAFGGGAAELAYDSYTPRGRWTVSWARIMRAEHRTNLQGMLDSHGMPDPEAADVQHALSLDLLRYRGRVAVTFETTAVYELNRNFLKDAFSMRVSSGVQYGW